MSENTGLEYLDLGLNDVNASDGDFTTISPGDYIFEVEKVAGGQSKKGKPKMQVNLRVIEALDEANKAMEGEMAIQSFSLDRSKKFPRQRIKALVNACGAEIDDQGGLHVDDLMNARFVASVKHEESTEIDTVTQEKTVRVFARVFRERHMDTLQDVEPAPKKKRNGRSRSTAAAADVATDDGDDAEAPAEKAPASGRGRGRRRSAPSR